MSGAYWCHQCRCSVRLSNDDPVCPACNDGFVEEIGPTERRLQFLETFSTMLSGTRSPSRSPSPSFNPMIVLRGRGAASDEGTGSLELYVDNGSGAGLRRLPAHLTDYIVGPGLERLIEQIGSVATSRGPPPASRSAVSAMPRVTIAASHVRSDLHCAVCKEAFLFGCEAREMPCSHLYHGDCILPWLERHNSCPMCRFEMPVDGNESATQSPETSPRRRGRAGLTVWRLPGGGVALGRIGGNAQREGGIPPREHAVNIESGPSIFNFNDDAAGNEVQNPVPHGPPLFLGPREPSRSFFSYLWPFRSSN